MTETPERIRIDIDPTGRRYTYLTLLDGYNHIYHEEYNDCQNLGVFLYKYYTKNGKTEGISKTYHIINDIEQLLVEENYLNGLRHGTYIRYHDNMNIRQKFTHVNGLKEGIYTSYYTNGNIEYEITFSKDVKEGVEKCYFPSGKLLYITNYKNNKKDGLHISYYESGVISSIANYSNNVYHGYIADYDTNGILKEEYIGINETKIPIKTICNYYCKRIKEDLVKAVYHPDRIERMAKKYSMECDDYLESI